MSKFGYKLKDLRIGKRLTQDELAKALDVSRSRIGMYEQGKREPDFETLEKIADFFNVSMSELIEDQKTEHPYYYNEDAKELADFMFKNPEYKGLFDAVRNVEKSDIKFVQNFIDRIKKN